MKLSEKMKEKQLLSFELFPYFAYETARVSRMTVIFT